MSLSNGDVSVVDNHENTHQSLHVESQDKIQVDLKYNDPKANLEKRLSNVQVLSTATIHDVIVELLKLLHLENVRPENVDFVGLDRDRYYSVVLENKSLTLQDLHIDNGYTLCFQCSAQSTSEQPSSLTIWFSGRADRIEFKWYRNVTTLGALLEYVIEVFSLEAVPRERVHLFLGLTELDVGSDYERLLKDLHMTDRTICEVEIIPPITDLPPSSKKISSNDLSAETFLSTESSPLMMLKLEYTDYFQDIKKNIHYPFLRTTTINHLIEISPQLFNLQSQLRSGEIEPTGFGFYSARRVISRADRTKSLLDLGIKDGDTVFFGPASDVSSKESSWLTIRSFDKTKTLCYQWNKTTTTLGMLINYIIKEFPLQSTDRNRIQLIRDCLDTEINHLSQTAQLLDSLGIKNHDWFTVKLLPLQSSSPDVRIECAFSKGMKTFDVPTTLTIAELTTQIEQQFEHLTVTHCKLFDRMHHAIDTTTPNKTLAEFGVQPHEVVYASVEVVYAGNDSSASKSITPTMTRSSSLVAKEQPEEVTILGKYPLDESIRMTMPVHESVKELLKKSEIFKTNRPAAKLKFTSGSIMIDSARPDRRLIDLGIQSGDVIQVETVESIMKKYELAKSPGSSPLMLDQPPKNYRFPSSPIGLTNLGNTCYMNSALQCLAHVKPLTQFFSKVLLENASEDQWNQFYTIGAVTGAYADVLKNLWASKKSFSLFSAFRPDHIKETIGLHAPRFATSDQQDAQEFLTHLLDEIHREYKEKNGQESPTIIEELFFGNLQSTITCQDCQHQTKTTNVISFLPLPLGHQGRVFTVRFIGQDGKMDEAIVHVPVDGQVKNIIEEYTNCHSFDWFSRLIVAMNDDGQVDIEMPVSHLSSNELTLIEQDEFLAGPTFEQMYKTSRKLTLQACLEGFCSVESLEDSWLCEQDSCQRHTKATKQLHLSSLPPILIIQLKRFSHTDGLRHKIETFVDFPLDGLNLTGFLPSTSEEIIYDLFAVCNHSGSIHGGHYIAYARHESNGKSDWYKFDDSFTSSLFTNADVLSKNAYLLFYMRRDQTAQSTSS